MPQRPRLLSRQGVGGSVSGRGTATLSPAAAARASSKLRKLMRGLTPCSPLVTDPPPSGVSGGMLNATSALVVHMRDSLSFRLACWRIIWGFVEESSTFPDMPLRGLTSTATLRDVPVKTSTDFGATTSSLGSGKCVSTSLWTAFGVTANPVLPSTHVTATTV